MIRNILKQSIFLGMIAFTGSKFNEAMVRLNEFTYYTIGSNTFEDLTRQLEYITLEQLSIYNSLLIQRFEWSLLFVATLILWATTYNNLWEEIKEFLNEK